jgi:energy-coupling factor transporter ATP-binding protein EcfA2
MSALSLMMREDHEKQSALADGCIQVIVPPKVDDRTQIEHHRFDQQAEWFRVTMTSLTAQGEEPILQVSDRFKKLCNPGAQFSLGQYPSLVSFVGDTGVGKSTLVRAMNTVGIVEQMQSAGIMDWRHVFGCQLHGPVTRATSARKTTRPTSVGVHLYRDQTIVHVRDDHGNQEDVPILYADCEGFSAGSMRTDAELSVAPSSSRAPSVTSGSQASQSSRSRPNAESSTPSESAVAAGMDGPLQLDLVIKTPGFKEMGKTSADVFYARFLYAFSDVVVFVINEEQKMKREMQRLLEWAVSAVKTSRSRSSPRTLLVVRNGPRNHHDSFYDDIDLKDEMFHDFGDIWDDSRVLSEYKEDHDLKCILNEDKIYDNDQYFKLFFRETKICYIPSIQNGQPPDRIYQQYSLLRKLIVGGVQAAQKARSKSYFRHDVASAIDLIGQAFRHFAEFNEPFDFHLAARKDNPTPMSIPGHIANLLRHLGTTKEKFSKFEIIVAVCLVSYNYRTSRHGM